MLGKCPVHLNDLPCSACSAEAAGVVTRFTAQYGKVVGDLDQAGRFTNIRCCQFGHPEELLGQRPSDLRRAW